MEWMGYMIVWDIRLFGILVMGFAVPISKVAEGRPTEDRTEQTLERDTDRRDVHTTAGLS